MQNRMGNWLPRRNKNRLATRVALFALLTVFAVAGLATGSYATGNINKGDLAGSWVLHLTGNTGCGLVAMQVTFTLNASGTGTASITTHGQCGDSVTPGQTFTVNTLAANGAVPRDLAVAQAADGALTSKSCQTGLGSA